MILLKFAQNRSQIGMSRLNRGEQGSVLASMMLAECRTKPATENKEIPRDFGTRTRLGGLTGEVQCSA